MNKFGSWLKGLSITKKVLLGVGTLVVIGAAAGNQPPTLNATNSTNKSGNTSTIQSTPKAAVKADSITFQTVTETQSIPFNSTTVQSSSLAKGTSKITTAGVDGTKTITYKVTYTNGVQTDIEEVSQEVTTAPVTQVTTVGTYVAPQPSCPNGSYVNSDGNTVCSPYASSSAPAGATAKCNDGTYSFSQHRSGTCSYHGGVAEWL